MLLALQIIEVVVQQVSMQSDSRDFAVAEKKGATGDCRRISLLPDSVWSGYVNHYTCTVAKCKANFLAAYVFRRIINATRASSRRKIMPLQISY